jgi:hypothetical protein
LHPIPVALEMDMGATQLYLTTSVEEQWDLIAAPWLRQQAGMAWKNPQPTVILTPSRAESFYLRRRLVGEGVPYFGLRFWTPSDARKFLHHELDAGIGAATQAELRLLARVCAERLIQTDANDNATLSSVAREPAAFLRAYDLLVGAGWDPVQAGAVYGRKLARTMQEELEALHLATQSALHRQLGREASSQKTSPLANVLMLGFNAAHWPLWDLLKAVVLSAEQSVVALSAPREFAQEIDQLWIGSWEEITQLEALTPTASTATNIANDAPMPFASLVDSYEKGASASAAPNQLTLLVTPEINSQIRAVVLQALDYLHRDSCTRLGIVFPEANALALGVAGELSRLGLPLDDGIGYLAPGLFEKRCWQTWLALQEEPGAQRLIAWLRACEAEGASSGNDSSMPARVIADVLESALGETLVDNLDFLARHLHEDSRKSRNGVVADFLRKRIALPETATFTEFLALTRRALAFSGWEQHLARLEIDPSAWLGSFRSMISRRIFLEWLKEAMESKVRTRGKDGNHFYGKIHLLIYAQISGQTWSHLILTGLNEGVWPRVFESGAFGSRHELAALNQQIRGLNHLGTAQGGQGSGHETVRPNHGHCLLPLERQDLAMRDLCSALEGTSDAVCLTAMTTAAGRSLLPSDFFSHAYQALTKRALDEETFRALASTTEEWCRKNESLLLTAPGQNHAESVSATRIAYAARRDETRPFGVYEFAFAKPPTQPIQLSCKRWEDAWNHPATVWLGNIVGATPWPEGTLSWPRAVGTWVHRWLARALHECRERGVPAEFPILLWAAADRESHRVHDLANEIDIDLYPWWEQVWAEARAKALSLGESLTPLLPERPFLSEIRLPDDMIALPGTGQPDFTLRGQIDLLFLEPGSPSSEFLQGNFSGCACWLVDFKTGSVANLTEKKIEQGQGLQPVLYALAVRARGATSTAISLHTPDAPLKQQVQIDDVVGITPLFRSLNIFHHDGIFGMRPDAVNAYGYSPSYPMATRFIPANILEAKWALVHGTAPAVGEEAE